jgi:hypothetical protein
MAVEFPVNWLALVHLVRDSTSDHHDCAIEWAAYLVQPASGLLPEFQLAELAVIVHQ